MNKASEKKGNVSKALQTAKLIKKKTYTKSKKKMTSLRFRRPKTLKLLRSPKYPTVAVPKTSHFNEFKTICYPLTSESAVKKMEMNNILVFVCDGYSTKISIKRAVEKIYGVKVCKINTLIRPDGKKKAFVRLNAECDAADIAEKMDIL